MVKIAIFDIDNTLTESRSVISATTAKLLSDLIDRMPVALISGGSIESFEKQVISHLTHTKKNNLYALPTSGAELRAYEMGDWKKIYSFPIGHDKRRAIFKELSKTLKISPVDLGQYIEDRGSQITYSALGKNAPLELKYTWDPTREKRRAIIKNLKPHLPGLSMTIGGSTSIDFTEEGIDKAFGVSKLLQHLNISPPDAVFVGDAMDKGGNDAPVKTIGVHTLETKSIKQTENIITGLIKEL